MIPNSIEKIIGDFENWADSENAHEPDCVYLGNHNGALTSESCSCRMSQVIEDVHEALDELRDEYNEMGRAMRKQMRLDWARADEKRKEADLELASGWTPPANTEPDHEPS